MVLHSCQAALKVYEIRESLSNRYLLLKYFGMRNRHVLQHVNFQAIDIYILSIANLFLAKEIIHLSLCISLEKFEK